LWEVLQLCLCDLWASLPLCYSSMKKKLIKKERKRKGDRLRKNTILILVIIRIQNTQRTSIQKKPKDKQPLKKTDRNGNKPCSQFKSGSQFLITSGVYHPFR
jgi:hypothetical protein